MYGLAMGIKRTFNGGLQKGGCRVIIKGQIIRATHAEKADDTGEGKKARLPGAAAGRIRAEPARRDTGTYPRRDGDVGTEYKNL